MEYVSQNKALHNITSYIKVCFSLHKVSNLWNLDFLYIVDVAYSDTMLYFCNKYDDKFIHKIKWIQVSLTIEKRSVCTIIKCKFEYVHMFSSCFCNNLLTAFCRWLHFWNLQLNYLLCFSLRITVEWIVIYSSVLHYLTLLNY